MAKASSPVNPFYVLVVLFGIVFLITVCAYGTMAYRAISPNIDPAAQKVGLMGFMDQYGVAALAVELTALGIATTGAMMLDRYRARQGAGFSTRQN
ncbi:MAG TPA: hypothetical protein VGJ16_11710 [Pirellulales bacterium]